MRIEVVKAHAFGPFAGNMLELSSGMNVICGPNESGKSSWHAAIYAGICGMRRGRGRATKEDQEFATRHRPWRKGSWKVALTIVLDDGRTIDIEQDLGSGGRSTATDRATRRPLGGDLVREGSVDAATLLGLTRETAVATIFVRQADWRRVLDDANELQEYLERAAATSAIETTADEALARIATYRRDHVGLLRSGSRGALATALRQLDRARAELDKAEELFESYQGLLARRHGADRDVRDIEQLISDVSDHEHERQQRERWLEFRAAERRLQQARLLAEEAASGPPDGEPGKDLVDAVTRALVAFEARPAEPAPLQGETADELEKDLAAIPAPPIGDLEPAPEVISSRESWHRERQRLAAHDHNQPAPSEAGETSWPEGPSAAEIETELEALPELPIGDLEPAPEVISSRESWHRERQRLAAHDHNQPAPSEAGETSWPEGPSAAEIETELEALPELPIGDLEPAPEVISSRESWHRERQRLAAHQDTEPVDLRVEPLPVRTSELRQLADELDSPLPVVDPGLQQELGARRAAPGRPLERPAHLLAESPTPKAAALRRVLRIAVVTGGVLGLVGVVLLAVGQAVPGAVALVLGAALAVTWFAVSRRPEPPSEAASALPTPDMELQRLEARLLLEEAAVAQAVRRREGAAARLAELKLPSLPVDLRQLANKYDSLAFEHERAAEWERRKGELESSVAAAGKQLQESLVAHGTEVGDEDDLDQAFQRYAEACHQRAQQAGQAARRGDLEARLRERRGAEAAYDAALERAAEWERRKGELESSVAAAGKQLQESLVAHGTEVGDEDDLDQAFQRYAEACHQRAQQAGQAARRGDLEARLRERRGAEAAYDAALERAAEWERRKGELESSVAAAGKQLQESLVAHGTEVGDEDDLDQAFQRYAEACHQRAQQAGQAARRGDLEARLRERRGAEKARENDVAARAAAERQLVALSVHTGQSDGADLENLQMKMGEWLEAQELLGVARQKRAELVARLDQVLDGWSLEELEAETAELLPPGDPPREDEGDLDDRSAELEALHVRALLRRNALAELVGQIDGAEGHLLDVSQAIEAEARWSSEVQRLNTLAEDLDMATEILSVAQQKVHADIAPVLNRTLRPWVPLVTQGRYDDIRVNPATLEVEAHESGGQFRPATVLSQGTTEQLFLLLRLALAQHLATTGESTPIVLDDVTVQSDAERTVEILDLLHGLSDEHQVVLFSQEDEVLHWAERQLKPPGDKLIRLSQDISSR